MLVERTVPLMMVAVFKILGTENNIEISFHLKKD